MFKVGEEFDRRELKRFCLRGKDLLDVLLFFSNDLSGF